MHYLGIDYGSKRIGLAVSSEDGMMSFPLSVLPNDKKVLGTIKELCAKRSIDALVLGESLDYNGKANPIMKKILFFKKELEEGTGLPVYLEPEFLTSAEAERLQGKHAMHDASAAALILKSYLTKHI